MKLTVVIPCYNEKNTILTLLERVKNANVGEGNQKEIIVVDDDSRDGTRELLKPLEDKYKIIYQDKNLGKGYALRTGFKHATGDIAIIQDADLEYDPNDYADLIAPIIKGESKVVYGSRERNKKNKTHSGLSFYLGGLFLTWLTNFLYGSDLTDVFTCYKVFEVNTLRSIPLICRRFEFDSEVTARILKKGIRIKEVPISYYPRKINDGKKINWKDGLQAIWTLAKYRFMD